MWSPPAPQPWLAGTNPARAGRSPVARWARARTGETRALRARALPPPPLTSSTRWSWAPPPSPRAYSQRAAQLTGGRQTQELPAP